MGCQLFFLLTGFKLCYSWHHSNSSKNIGVFYLKRFISIAPLYYFAILFWYLWTKLYVTQVIPPVLQGIWYQNPDPKAIIKNILLLNGLFLYGNNDVVGGGWYIGVTAIFYALFPVFIKVFDYVNKKCKTMVLMLPTAIFFLMQVLRGGLSQISFIANKVQLGYYSFFEQVPCILLGMGLFYTYFESRSCDEQKNRKFENSILLAVLMILLAANVYNFYPVNYIDIAFLFTIMYFVLFLFVGNVWDKIRNYKIVNVVEALGKVSYPLFFVHVFFVYDILPVIYRYFNMHMRQTVYWLVSLAVSIPVMYVIAKGLNVFNKKIRRIVLSAYNKNSSV